jgi:hypothetical protein
MKYSILLASVIAATATAFAPSGKVVSRSQNNGVATQMSYEEEVGAQPPLGFWDPLGLLKDADAERFNRLRYVEIKHGRISMLAVLGHIVTTAGELLIEKTLAQTKGMMILTSYFHLFSMCYRHSLAW